MKGYIIIAIAAGCLLFGMIIGWELKAKWVQAADDFLARKEIVLGEIKQKSDNVIAGNAEAEIIRLQNRADKLTSEIHNEKTPATPCALSPSFVRSFNALNEDSTSR